MNLRVDFLKILGLGVIGLGFLLAVLAYQLLDKYQASAYHNESMLATIRYFMGFCVVLCIIGFSAQILDQHKKLNELQTKYDIFTNSRSRLSHLTGRINEPLGGTAVPKSFQCVGTADGFKEGEGVHLWVAAEINGRLWPKGHEIICKDGKWRTKVFQDSDESAFGVALIAADEDANGRIEAWIRHGQNTGRFESLEGLAGIISLDRIDNVRLAANQ